MSADRHPVSSEAPLGSRAERLVRVVTHFMGSTPALLLSSGVIVLWLATGLRFGFGSVRYELFEDALTAVTFVMVFILQRAQNKDTLAIQLKLNELVASSPRASNRLLNAEEITESELERLRRHFQALDALARDEERPDGSHSVDEMCRKGDDEDD